MMYEVVPRPTLIHCERGNWSFKSPENMGVLVWETKSGKRRPLLVPRIHSLMYFFLH